MAERGEARMANSKTACKVAKKGKEGGEQADALYSSDVFRMYCYKVGQVFYRSACCDCNL